MIIQTWDVSKYNYVIVFILSCYLMGSMMYLLYSWKKKRDFKKVLIHISIGAIIVLTASYTISTYSYKTVHIIYQYSDEAELSFLVDRGWELEWNHREVYRAHLTKAYKTNGHKWFNFNTPKRIEELE